MWSLMSANLLEIENEKWENIHIWRQMFLVYFSPYLPTLIRFSSKSIVQMVGNSELTLGLANIKNLT